MAGCDQNHGVRICTNHPVQLHRAGSGQYIHVCTGQVAVWTQEAYLRRQATSKHWRRRGLNAAATEDRGYAANEASHSADGHSKCCMVSGIRSERFCDWNDSGGRWGPGSIDSRSW